MLLDVNKQVTKNLPVAPSKDAAGNWKNNGLNAVKLVSVDTDNIKYEKGEFAGLTAKIIKFHFEGLHTPSEPDTFFIHSEKIIGTKANDGTEEEPNLVDRPISDVENNIQEMWGRIKHLLDGITLASGLRNIASLDAKKQKQYLNLSATGTPEERIKQFDTFFQFIADFINGTGEEKSMLTNEKGEHIVTGWLKLVPNHPTRKFYVIPTWVGTGFFEYAKIIDATNKKLSPARIIRVNPALAAENLELSKPKSSTDPNSPMGTAAPVQPQGVSNDVMNFLAGQK